MNLSAAITKLSPGWEVLFQQIGIPYKVLDETVTDYSEYPVIIINSKNINKTKILDYIKECGCVLIEADYAESIFNIKTRRLPLKFICAHSDEIFKVELICDLYAKCNVADGANHLPNQDNQNCVLSKQIGKGKIIVFPSPFTSLLLNSQIQRKNFYSEYGSKETNERVASVSKGMIYHYAKNALEHLFHYRRIPFVSLWQFPDGQKNLFLFRVDTDFGSPQQIDNLYNVCRENNIKATWFVETKSLENQEVPFAQFKEQEIGLHCYRHRNYLSYKKNYENITKGKKVLANIGFNPDGFAAPYGEWSKEINSAAEDCNFNYASEFGYSYDSFPMFPYVNKRFSKLIQIPIHSMSIGRLKWGGHDEKGILKYFLTVIEEKISLQETIALYTHPGEENFELWDEIFKNINSYGIKSGTFNSYSEWWKERISFCWESFIVDGKIKIKSPVPNSRIYVRIYEPNGEVYIAPIDNIDKKIKIEEACLIKNYKVSLNSLREKTLRMIRHDILSRYRKLKQ